MSNISITRRCRRGCTFCFAALELRRPEGLDMSRAVFEGALSFLERSGIPEARLLGGEPTEHPEFGELLARALDRGFAVTVFSGGLMPEGSLECLSQVPPERVTIVLNSVVPGVDPEGWVRAQERVCEKLGDRVELGITLSAPRGQPDFLLRLIERHGLRRRVRLGLAHPIWGGDNRSLRLQSARMLGSRLEGFIAAAEGVGVVVDFDCGFTPCMFSARFMEEHPALAGSIGTRCGTIVDILPEGAAIACYALSSFMRLPLTGIATREELIGGFDRELDRLLPAGVYADCVSCDHRLCGSCNGGCRARRALRLRPDPARLVESN